MLLFLIFYVILYTANLYSLYYIFKITFAEQITRISVAQMIYYMVRFSKLKPLYYGLVLNLVGIPPFLFFFIKFNFLIHMLPKVSFFLFYIIFLILFLHMIFYIQGLYLKDVKFDSELIKFTKTEITFRAVYWIIMLLIISYFGVFWFLDLYITLTLAV